MGLATRGGSKLGAASIIAAIDRGVNYLNSCGQPTARAMRLAVLDRVERK